MESQQNVLKAPTGNAAWFLTLALTGLLTYLSGINIPYYGDDFSFYPDSSCSSTLRHFLQKHPRTGFYRPVDSVFSACIQHNFDAGTVPVHLTALSLHSILAYLVFVAVLKSGFDRIQATLGSTYMLLSQANAFALLSNDTLSQVCATFFGCLSLWSLHTSHHCKAPTARPRWVTGEYRTCAFSLLAFGIALIAKESSASFFPLLLAVIAINHRRQASGAFHARRAFVSSIPYCVVFGAYLGVRFFLDLAAPAFGGHRYDFRLGANIFINVALLLYASLVPVSSVTAYSAIETGSIVWSVGIASMTLMLVVAIGYGLWRSQRRGTILAVGVFAVTALFPMALMNHVSELYAYNCAPFIAMLVGLGLGSVIRMARGGWSRKCIVVLVGALFASHMAAVRTKASLMKANGERATRLMEELQAYIQEVPSDGELVLVNGDSLTPEYAVFLVRGFNVLRHGEWKLKRDARREDAAVRIIEEREFDPTRDGRKKVVLGLREGAIYRYGP